MNNTEFEYTYAGLSFHEDICESIIDEFDRLFYDDSQSSNKVTLTKATIVKWNDCTGKIVVPDQIDDQTIVFGISSHSFVLSEKTKSIEIPSSVERIDEDAFDTDRLPTGYSPIIRINYKWEKRSIVDSMLRNGWLCIYSGWTCSDFISERCLIHYEKDGIAFKYRKLNEYEIEIVRWISPDDVVVIPGQIEEKLTIVSIGKSAFKGNSHLIRVVVPETVRSIQENAFYYLNHAEYIYGDQSDWGWSESGEYPDDCVIQLPENLSEIRGNAFLRGTEDTDRRHRHDCFINRLAIEVPCNSPSMDTMLSLGWKVKVEKNMKAILLLDEKRTDLQGWIFSNLFLERNVVFNRVGSKVYEQYLE